MELAGDITKQDIKDTLEAILDSNFWNEANRLGVTVEITVDNDFVPTIDFNTNNNNIKVRITTVNVKDEDGDLIGWQFNPHLITASEHFNWDSDGNSDIVHEIESWSSIARLVQKIWECEFYLEDYFD